MTRIGGICFRLDFRVRLTWSTSFSNNYYEDNDQSCSNQNCWTGGYNQVLLFQIIRITLVFFLLISYNRGKVVLLLAFDRSIGTLIVIFCTIWLLIIINSITSISSILIIFISFILLFLILSVIFSVILRVIFRTLIICILLFFGCSSRCFLF